MYVCVCLCVCHRYRNTHWDKESLPSPSLSKREKASLNSATWVSVSSAMAKAQREEKSSKRDKIWISWFPWFLPSFLLSLILLRLILLCFFCAVSYTYMPCFSVCTTLFYVCVCVFCLFFLVRASHRVHTAMSGTSCHVMPIRPHHQHHIRAHRDNRVFSRVETNDHSIGSSPFHTTTRLCGKPFFLHSFFTPTSRLYRSF